MYYVYILQSTSSSRFYVGHCEHLLQRFHEHRTGQNRSTHNRGPW
ncbi:MAG: GIY-YIG nuclease family protein [Verrucomicrobia bacterium]|nr:GIY-YIG nuclease family protein [Verrucomicrobiota bacterium]